ncbi:hypothetical protein LSH36_216g02008 [Paralvinella palmiformis]|uniref:Uncharacterized protein n=1 Tax=Paralvinella palmiformis TaxID=53620 RepID=A0AAD9JP41_9ANNE|nr:hypothetical protein LSH36_216g02008 [Paralvinella palmiformis]
MTMSMIMMDPPVEFEDEFDEMRARATSGGSLYGLLRRQAFLQGAKKVDPDKRCMVRQRSKSLITKSVALPEEKSILKMLCEYAESSRKQTDLEQRRHSTACLEDARDANHINHLSPIRRIQNNAATQQRKQQPHVTSSTTHAQVHFSPSTNEVGCAKKSEPEVRFVECVRTIPICDNFLSPNDPMGARTGSTLPPFPVGTPSMYRRRSFSVTPKGIVNQGDNIVEFQLLQHPGHGHGQNPYGVEFGSTGSDLQLLCKTSPSDSYTSIGSVDSAETVIYRVLMLGGPGVGKSALSQQFLTSEHMMAQNTSFGK